MSSSTRWLTWEPYCSLVLSPIHHPGFDRLHALQYAKIKGKGLWDLVMSDDVRQCQVARQKVDTWGWCLYNFTLICALSPKPLWMLWPSAFTSIQGAWDLCGTSPPCVYFLSIRCYCSWVGMRWVRSTHKSRYWISCIRLDHALQLIQMHGFGGPNRNAKSAWPSIL